MVVHVREGRQAQGIAGTDRGPQVGNVGLSRSVASFVFGLGVDHQAVGSAGHSARAQFRLTRGIGAVYVLPRTRPQPVGVQRRHQFWAELAPVVRGPVGALDEQRGHSRRVSLGDDRREIAAVGLTHIPDPHALSIERGAAGCRDHRCGGRRGGVQRIAHHLDRAVGVGVAAVAQQDHDAPRMGAAGYVHHHPRARAGEMAGGGIAGDASVPAVRERHLHPLA